MYTTTNISIIVALVVCAVLLMSIGVLFFSADVVFCWKAKKIRMTEKRIVVSCANLSDFESKLLVASVQMIDSGKKPEFPTLTGDTFIKRAAAFWKEKDAADIFNLDWAECGWLFYAMAESNYDIQYIRKIFLKKIFNSPFNIVDQCPGGMVAILLYEKTGKGIYKDYADRLYDWLVERDTEHGVLYREQLEFQLVDVLGMAIPYLMYYAKTFNVSNASTIAYKTFEQFVYYGCDHATGMPTFEYSINSPYLKSGVSDWGRGLAWFIIGLSYLAYNQLSPKTQSIISRLNATLLNLWNNNHSFGHFIAQRGRDLSAELPILYYLIKSNQIEMNEKQLLYYSTMCHDGLMYHSSSSNHGLVSYGLPYGYNSLSQAYMLRIINSYNNSGYLSK